MANILERIDEFFAIESAAEEPIQEIIGRTVLGDTQVSFLKSRTRVKTVDETIPDYEYYDKLRRGKARGYALGSLFAKRIENIYASWTMGDGVFVKLQEAGDEESEDDPRVYTDAQLADFLNKELPTLLQVVRDKFGLGDQYVVVNVDGSLSVPSPDTVEVFRNELDYRDIIAVEITTKTEKTTIVDRYTPEQRTITVKKNVGGAEETFTFSNLFGRIPIVHLAYGMSANETNGHSVHEQLVPLYDQYDEVVFKQLDGVKLLGAPMLAIEGLDDLTAVINLNEPSETSQYKDKDGNLVDRQELNIDENAVLLIGKGGHALFVAPPVGFSADTQQALKTLFYMMLEHVGIPEWIWGTQVSSGRSSTDTQLTQWTKDVQAMRGSDEKWIREMCELWIITQKLVDPKIVVDELAVSWPELLPVEAAMLLEQLRFTLENNILTKQATLELLNLVDDAALAVEAAEKEMDAEQERLFPDGDSNQFNRRLLSDDPEYQRPTDPTRPDGP